MRVVAAILMEVIPNSMMAMAVMHQKKAVWFRLRTL